MSLSFITGINFSKSMLAAINHITYIYNPNWRIGDSDTATFPVAFFHVKSIHEKYEAKVSQKQMIFYNSIKNTNPVKGTGSLNVIADNIIIQPKQYIMDVIIPYDNLTLLEGMSTPALAPYQVNNVIYTSFGGSNENNTARAFSVVAGVARNVVMSILRLLVNLGNLQNQTTFEELYKTVTATKDFNKKSLEEMFYNRGILKMKMWDSWKYKYVAITGMDITKEGTEDGVYEASITFQEVPIMYMSNIDVASYIKNESATRYSNPTVEAAGKFLVETLDKIGD